MAVAAALSMAVASDPAAAQQVPDAGTLLRDAARPTGPPLVAPAAAAPVLPATPRGSAAAPSTLRVKASSFRVTGATLVPDAALQTALAPFVGRELSFADLQAAADTVTAVYRAHGWLARALLPEQSLDAGVIRIDVIEARLGSLRLARGEQPLRLRESTVRRFMLARNREGQPVNVDDSQRAVNLLNDLPGVRASALLEPGRSEGESSLVVKAQDLPLWSGFAQADNGGVHSTGTGRFSALVSLDDALGLGDQFGVTTSLSQHSRFGRLGGSLPVGGDGLRAGIAGSWLSYGYSTASRFEGSAGTLGTTLTYPLHRANDWNLNLGAAADAKRFKNTHQTGDVVSTLSDKTVASTSLLVSGNAYDGFAGGGYNQFLASLVAGRLDLDGDAADLAADQATGGPRRDGHYARFSVLATRLQWLTAADSLFVSVSGQAASKNLDSSEKVGMGGPNAVRAYPAGEANGDEGLLLTLEWRRRFGSDLQVAVFYDAARVRRDHRRHAGSEASGTFNVSGAGVALNWGDARTLAFSASVAARLGSNPLLAAGSSSDPNGTRSHTRFWLSALRTF